MDQQKKKNLPHLPLRGSVTLFYHGEHRVTTLNYRGRHKNNQINHFALRKLGLNGFHRSFNIVHCYHEPTAKVTPLDIC